MGKHAKTIRKEAKGLYQTVLDTVVNPRLTAMEAYVKEQMEKMASQQKRINGFILGEVKFTIQNELDDARVTRVALLEILSEKPGYEELIDQINARKPATRKRLIEEAEAKMKAEQEAARAQADAGATAQAALSTPQVSEPSQPQV